MEAKRFVFGSVTVSVYGRIVHPLDTYLIDGKSIPAGEFMIEWPCRRCGKLKNPVAAASDSCQCTEEQ